MKIGLQLFTVRREAKKSFMAHLKKSTPLDLGMWKPQG